MLKHSQLSAKDRAARVHYYLTLRRDNPDSPAAALWQSALAQLHFRATLKAQVADYKKRSKAARKGWDKRRGYASAKHVSRGKAARITVLV